MLILSDRWQTVEHLAFGPGVQLAVAYSSGLAVWDAAAGQQVARCAYSSCPPAPTRVSDVIFPPDGRAVFVADSYQGVRTFRLPGLVSVPFDMPVGRYCTAAAASAGGRFVVAEWVPPAETTDAHAIRGFRLDGDGPPSFDWEVRTGYANGLAFFPDGDRFATVGASAARVVVRGWPGGKLVGDASYDRAEPARVAVSADGDRVAVVAGPHLRVWPASLAGDPLRAATGSRRHFTGLAFHPSGRWLAATSNDQTVKLYDPDSLDVARTYTWGIGKLKGVAFSADGTLAAAAGEGGRVVVWDVDE